MFSNCREESKQQSQKVFLNLRASRPGLKMYKVVLGSEWNKTHATKNQTNFQGPFLAPSAEGINLKCRLGQEKQKELMEQHVQDLFMLPGHLKLFENDRVVCIKRDSKHQGTVFTATQHPSFESFICDCTGFRSQYDYWSAVFKVKEWPPKI